MNNNSNNNKQPCVFAVTAFDAKKGLQVFIIDTTTSTALMSSFPTNSANT
jgi:hypothetical protein